MIGKIKTLLPLSLFLIAPLLGQEEWQAEPNDEFASFLTQSNEITDPEIEQQTEEILRERAKTPDQVQAELDQAQKDFERAQKLFIPWYTGPLITGSANNVPAGKSNFQGYLFFEDVYAVFNNSRKSISIDDIFTINPLLVLQHGWTSWLDTTLITQGFFRWQDGRDANGFGDMTLTFGIQLVKQTPYVPSVRLTVGETFPTGRFEKFTPSKASIEGTGSGAFTTAVGLNFNKIFWQMPRHPISLRLTLNYAMPNHEVDIKGFNSFGGGFGTNGDVCVGQTFAGDFAFEVSLTQKWVFAMDFAYFYSRSTSFSGFTGVDATGAAASVGGPSSDQFSLAPAIEYNPDDKGGLIAGVWFSVTGRNSANFISGIISYTHIF